MRVPRTHYHHMQGYNEWTINDEVSEDTGRFYEDTEEIITAKGDC
jgi:hypothetical protein